MNTPDKCPHCGAIRIEGREYACGYIFRQNVRHNPRTHECLLNSERTAHAATRKELEKAESRVRELEGLIVIGRTNDCVTVMLSQDLQDVPPTTLGEAMLRKEGV